MFGNKVSRNNSKKIKKQNNRQRLISQISNLSVAKFVEQIFVSMVKIPDENCKSFWNMLLGRPRKITPPSPPLPKDEVLKDVGHSMSIENLHLGVNSITALF